MRIQAIPFFLTVVLVVISPGSSVPQVLLESNPDTSVPVCPDVPLVFTCTGTELGVLRWFRDGTQFFSIDNDASITLDDPPDGLQVVVNRNESIGPTTADFTLTLTVDNATLVGDSEICCGLSTSFDNCTTATLIATSAPTIASIREETVKSVNITLEEPAEGSECVEDYIIQYEGRSTSTNGTLSVVIEDVVFCSVAPVTFSVTAVLGGGSVIDGSESDFILTGQTLDIVTIMVNTSNVQVINATTGELTVEWDESGNGSGCDCISGYIVRVNGNDVSTTDCAEGETTVQLQLCEEHRLTIVPVLNNGITVESSSSNVAPVLIEFLTPMITETNCCSENRMTTVAVILSELEIDNLRTLDPNAMIEVLYDDMMEIFTAEQLVMMDYQLMITAELNSTEEITIRLTFISGSCESMVFTTVQCEEPPLPEDDEGDGDESQLDTATAVGITTVITALVMFTTGVIVGIMVVYCTTRWRRSGHLKVSESPLHHPSPSQRPPVYEEVTGSGVIPVSGNAAYSPVPPPEGIELRENVAYGPV